MKNMSIGLLLIAGICGAVYLPTVLAADRPEKQNPMSHADTMLSPIEINCQITMTDAEGNSEIVAAPRVIAFEGKTATVTVTQDNGESIEIKLVGRLHPKTKPDEMKAQRPNRK